ncbi:hypothetical protein ACMD2_08469 [Ananas comosus]|uniref:Uncharacterized protein n=1 Tax=Ananas comosus TaxID=4615 RepID=A0A199UX15_ANACO|nr:hypothetical protein ACMD2_08469 [Ananas comosus]
MALAKGTVGKSTERHPGSNPNTNIAVVSNVSLRNTSCRSNTKFPSAKWLSNGTSPFSSFSFVD